MTRELTGQEAMVMDKARKNYINIKNYPYPGYEIEGSEGFIAGFTAALEYAATLRAENEVLQEAATRLRIASTALVGVCKEAERFIIGIPDDKPDSRDADSILDKLDWAITQAAGWTAERAALAKGGE